MTAPFFVDTNILVYAEDSNNVGKQRRARALLERGLREGTGRLSLQVLREFFSAATRKLGLSAEAARARIEIYALMQPSAMTTDDLLAAIDLHRLHGWSIWDALIVKAAQNAGCVQLLTEDLQHGRRIGTLEIINPFLEP